MIKTGCSGLSTVDSSLKWASLAIKSHRSHNVTLPSSCQVDHGFTLNYGVFHPQGIMLTHLNRMLRLEIQPNVSVGAVHCACQRNNITLMEFKHADRLRNIIPDNELMFRTSLDEYLCK